MRSLLTTCITLEGSALPWTPKFYWAKLRRATLCKVCRMVTAISTLWSKIKSRPSSTCSGHATRLVWLSSSKAWDLHLSTLDRITRWRISKGPTSSGSSSVSASLRTETLSRQTMPSSRQFSESTEVATTCKRWSMQLGQRTKPLSSSRRLLNPRKWPHSTQTLSFKPRLARASFYYSPSLSRQSSISMSSRELSHSLIEQICSSAATRHFRTWQDSLSCRERSIIKMTWKAQGLSINCKVILKRSATPTGSPKTTKFQTNETFWSQTRT